MKVVFWNLRGASASDQCVHQLVANEKPNLLALAEYTGLNQDGLPQGYVGKRLSPRLFILSKSAVTVLPPSDKRLRDFAQIVSIDGWSIAVCHLKSALNDGESERDSQMRKLKVHLKRNVLWAKLAVIGDLNANPWESCLVDKESLHGLQTRVEAAAGLDYDGEHYQALLNESYQLARPFTTDSGGEVWGTYREKEEKLHSSLRWHIFDQALVSSDVKATVSLRTGLPSLPWHEGLGRKGKAPVYPDHLPIVVELEAA